MKKLILVALLALASTAHAQQTIIIGSSTGTPLSATTGGTGQSTWTIGDMLVASSSTALAKLAAGSSGLVLTANGAGVAPTWQAPSGGAGSLAATLAIGQVTGGYSIIVSNGDGINGADGVAGVGRDLALRAGNGDGANNQGGQFNARAGNSFGSGTGAVAYMLGGDGGATGAGGAVSITGGSGGATSGNGGTATVTGGTAALSGTGGIASLIGGAGVGTSKAGGTAQLVGGAASATGSAQGGAALIQAGAGGPTATGQSVTITGGAGGSTSGAAGSVILTGGVPIDGAGGAITITTGNGVGTLRTGGTLTATAGNSAGTNRLGATTTLNLAQGTGTGAGGTLVIAASPVLGTGTTVQTRATVATFSGGGALGGGGDNTGAILALAGSSTTTGGPLTNLSITSTWANSNSTFGCIKVAVTDPAGSTGSNAASLLVDINAGTAGTLNLFSIRKDGNVNCNTATTAPSIGNLVGAVNVFADGTSSTNAYISNQVYCAASAVGPMIYLIKGRGTVASPGAVQASDACGTIVFNYFTTAGSGNWNTAAQIKGVVDGAPSGSATPGRLILATTPSGSAATVDRWCITNAGHLQGTNVLFIGWPASTTDPSGAPEVTISKNAVGVLQVGTTAANALGSLRANAYSVGSPTLVAGQYAVGTGFGSITHWQGPSDANAVIQGGSSASFGRGLTLAAGAAAAATNGGGNFSATGGAGLTSGVGGTSSLIGGAGGNAAGGGQALVTGGRGTGTDKNAGGVAVSTGISTGAGTSTIDFLAAPVAGTGTGDNTPVSRATITATAGLSLTKTIDTTAGDAATIDKQVGRFRKDTTGAAFTLTNSFITANSVIVLTAANAAMDVTATSWTVSAGAGSATITFVAAPTANFDMNFAVIN